MGNTVSQNIINDVVNIVHKTVNSATMTNELSASQVYGIHVVAAGDVTISDITINQNLKVMQTSKMDAKTKAKFNDDIKEKLKQAAESVKAALSLNPGSVSATNITNVMTTLTTEVSNSFSMVNKQTLDQTSGIEATSGGNVIIHYVTINQANETIMNSIMTSSAVQKSLLKLAQAISQTAKAKSKGMLSGLMMVLLLVVGGGVVFGKKLLKPEVFLPVAGAAAGGFYYMTDYRTSHPKT